jgi:hypothetical protein
VLNDDRKFVQSETLLTKALEIERRLFGESDPRTLETMSKLGLSYAAQSKLG